MEALSDKDLAVLHTRFVLPLTVGQMLRGEEAFDDTAEYAFNTILSELRPDTGLLCIALCAQHVGVYCNHLRVARMLKAEADRIAEEYGSLWLAYEARPNSLSTKKVAVALSYLLEDLEAMAHLLEATLSELEEKTVFAICEVLALQAREHMDIAEVELSNLEVPVRRRKTSSNIIPFPQNRIRALCADHRT